MDPKNNQQAQQRNQAVRRYKDALERSDFTVVTTILGEAEHDPILETMLLKVDLSAQSQDGILIDPEQLRQARRFLRVLHQTTQRTLNDETFESKRHSPPAGAEKKGILQERSFPPLQTKTSPLTLNPGPRRGGTSRFIRFLQMAAAVLIVGALIASSLLLFSGRLGKPPQAKAGDPPSASVPGIYISRSNSIYRLDPQTRKIIWQKSLTSQSPSPLFTTLSITTVISDTIYVTDHNASLDSGHDEIFALDAQTGTLRWSHTFPQGILSGPTMDQDLLYFSSVATHAPNLATTLYAVNPASGQVVATYTPQYGGPWYAHTVVDGVMYYIGGTNSNILYAEQLSEKKLLWQQQFSNDLLENEEIVVQNGIVYIPVTPMTTLQNGWIDAFNAHSGTKLWQSPALMAGNGRTTLLITDTMIYVSTSDKLLAFDIHTHALIWQQSYKTSDIQMASGILYISFSVNTHTQYPSTSSFLAALNASTGELLWKTPPNPVGGNMLITIVHGIFYSIVWDMLKDNVNTGTIYALNARNGTQIWTMPTDVGILQWGGMVVV